jgi:hypothetical protein
MTERCFRLGIVLSTPKAQRKRGGSRSSGSLTCGSLQEVERTTMRKLLMILIGVLALVVPAGAIAAGSPKWTAYPSCTASTTTLTCTGRAVAVHPQSMPNLGPLGVAVFGRLLYTCLEPYFQTDWSGSFLNGNVLSSVNYKSGRSFSISYDAPYSPPTMNAGAQCLSGLACRRRRLSRVCEQRPQVRYPRLTTFHRLAKWARGAHFLWRSARRTRTRRSGRCSSS